MPMDPITIRSSSNSNLEINAIPGHFVTSHSHINYYIDITAMKHDFTMAREAAETLAGRFSYEKPVDAIICMDGTEVIGAFLAQALAKSSAYTVNSQKNIYVVPPEFSTNGQIIFRDNLEPMIAGHHVLLLLASVTTGKTIHRALECIAYYKGYTEGIAAIFSACDEIEGHTIHHLFSCANIPDYTTCSFRDCKMCHDGVPIDALANSFGFSTLR